MDEAGYYGSLMQKDQEEGGDQHEGVGGNNQSTAMVSTAFRVRCRVQAPFFVGRQSCVGVRDQSNESARACCWHEVDVTNLAA